MIATSAWAAFLTAFNISAAPVVDPPGRPVGVLSRIDIVRHDCEKVEGVQVRFLCRPFRGARPTEAQWLALIAGLEALHRREGLDLIALDPLAALLPGHAETSSAKLFDSLLPLQALANQGPATWVLHHPAKHCRLDGQMARGSGAMSGIVDIAWR